jgi:hypothetical protein
VEIKIGPTGEHPHGKLRDDDKGGLNCAVSVVNGVVYLEFGTTLSWVAMSKDETLALIRTIIDALKRSEENHAPPAA